MRTHSGFFSFIGSICLATLSTGWPSHATETGSIDCPIEEFRMDQDIPNLTVQDQDDLGICYASTAATMLQMVDPEQRAVSALDLSLHTYASNLTDQTPLVTSKKVLDSKGNEVIKYKGFNESGNTCDAIRKAVEKGSCPQELSALENTDLGVYDRAMERIKKQAEAAKTAASKSSSNNPFSTSPNANQKPKTKNPFGPDQSSDANSTEKQVNPVKLQATVLHQLAVFHDDLKQGKVNSANLSTYLKIKAPELLNQFRQNAKTDTEVKLSFPAFQQGLNSCPIPSFKDLNNQINKIASTMEKISADQQFEMVLKNMADPNLNLVLGAISPACLDQKNRITYPTGLDCNPVQRPGTVREFNQVLLKSMIAGLDQNQKPIKGFPVGMLLCSAFLKHPAPYTDPSAFKNCAKYKGDSHFVTIIGARKNSAGSCEFLLQNSWGADCKSHLKDCKNGRVWVDDLTLYRNAAEMDVMTSNEVKSKATPRPSPKKIPPGKGNKK